MFSQQPSQGEVRAYLKAQSGPPVNRSHSEPDSNVQKKKKKKKCGRKEHIKPKQNLSQNKPKKSFQTWCAQPLIITTYTLNT